MGAAGIMTIPVMDLEALITDGTADELDLPMLRILSEVSALAIEPKSKSLAAARAPGPDAAFLRLPTFASLRNHFFDFRS
jgi:hypothetical protein